MKQDVENRHGSRNFNSLIMLLDVYTPGKSLMMHVASSDKPSLLQNVSNDKKIFEIDFVMMTLQL